MFLGAISGFMKKLKHVCIKDDLNWPSGHMGTSKLIEQSWHAVYKNRNALNEWRERAKIGLNIDF